MSRLVAGCRCHLSLIVVTRMSSTIDRERSRHVAACRVIDFLNVGDVLVDRRWRDEVLLAERRFYQSGSEVTFGAIALDAARCAGESGAGVPLKRLVDGERKVAVEACRDLSRMVVHGRIIPRLLPRLARLSP